MQDKTTFSEKRKKLAANKKIKKAKKRGVQHRVPSETDLRNIIESYQNGRYDDAERLALSITQRFPNHQLSWKVLGSVFKIKGRKSEALDAYQEAAALSPEDAEAHYNLGNTLKEVGRLDEAEVSYKQAIALRPVFAEAHNNLGNTLKELGRLDEAKAILSATIALRSDYAEAHYNLGNTLKELGRLDEAEVSLRQAIVLNPVFAEAHNNLGVTLQFLDRLDEAESCLRQAIAVKSDYAEAYNNLGNTLKEMGRLDDAETSFWAAIELRPDYAEAYNNVGVTLQEQGRLEQADVNYMQAILLNPDYPEAHNNLGVTLQRLGKLKEAETSFRHAIVLKNDYAEAHRYLSSVKTFEKRDDDYNKMQELAFDKHVSEEQRCHINFGLAKANEDLGEFEQAFQHYSEGNVLRKKLLNYNVSQDIELFEQLKSSYPQIERSSLNIEKTSNKPKPIFIIGMPRSGTTLVEQVVSSHSEVTGAGELPFTAQYGRAIACGVSDPSTYALLDFRERYLMQLHKLSEGNSIVTDKEPQNFRYIGLLAAAFPEAKIVHVKRNSAAVCWSNYKQYFESKSIGYCYSLDDIVQYYGLYQHLMEFWETQLSNKIYNLDYERLTIDQENETRKLINYLGLVWEKTCLSPQNNARGVATASNMQVREKIYRGSSQQWKRFQPFLNGQLNYL